MNIDDKIKELENITVKLEKTDITFEDSLALYEKGLKLAKELYGEVEEAKGKITIIKQDLDKFKEEKAEI